MLTEFIYIIFYKIKIVFLSTSHILKFIDFFLCVIIIKKIDIYIYIYI